MQDNTNVMLVLGTIYEKAKAKAIFSSSRYNF